jgi:hypothetical protein
MRNGISTLCILASVVQAQLSLKAMAWARLSRAHGLSCSQAEPGFGLGYGFQGSFSDFVY